MSTSLPCPHCGHFNAWPLTSEAAVEYHLRIVHGVGEKRDGRRLELAEALVDRLHHTDTLLPCPEGRCDDCTTPARRVWMGERQLCRPCARLRITAARQAA
jgi:hypothetical protein